MGFRCPLTQSCFNHLKNQIDNLINEDEASINAVVALPTGTGKTLLALKILDYASSKDVLKPCRISLVLAPYNVILDQFEREAKKLWGKSCVQPLRYPRIAPSTCRILFVNASDSSDYYESVSYSKARPKTSALRGLLQSIILCSKFFRRRKKVVVRCRRCHYIIAMTPNLLMEYYKRYPNDWNKLIEALDAIIIDEAHYGYPIRVDLYGTLIHGYAKLVRDILGRGGVRVTLALTATPTLDTLGLVLPGNLPAATNLVRRILCEIHEPCYATLREAARRRCVIGDVDFLVPKIYPSKPAEHPLGTAGKPVGLIVDSLEDHTDPTLMSRLAYRALSSLWQLTGKQLSGGTIIFPKTLMVVSTTEVASKIAVTLYDLLREGRPSTPVRLGVVHTRLDEHLGLIDGLEDVISDSLQRSSLSGLGAKELVKSTLKRFREGRINLLIAVNMLSLGFDEPNLDALIIGRPFTSITAYVQIRGRLVRLPEAGRGVKALARKAFLVDLLGLHRDFELLASQGLYGPCSLGGLQNLESLSDVRYDLVELDAYIQPGAMVNRLNATLEARVNYEVSGLRECIPSSQGYGYGVLVYTRKPTDCLTPEPRLGRGGKCFCPLVALGGYLPAVEVYEITEVKDKSVKGVPLGVIYCSPRGFLSSNIIEERLSNRMRVENERVRRLLNDKEINLVETVFGCRLRPW